VYPGEDCDNSANRRYKKECRTCTYKNYHDGRGYQRTSCGLWKDYDMEDQYVHAQCTELGWEQWKAESWNECSAICGGGEQSRSVRCENGHCDYSAKPETERPCNLQACPWVAEKWENVQCSKSCGGGVKTRNVTCSVGDLCDPESRPEDSLVCNKEVCPVWMAQDWGECSKTCGTGSQTRDVGCNVEGCDEDSKPVTTQTCNEQDCPEWEAGVWSACDKPCGGGRRSRSVKCSYGECDENLKPKELDECGFEHAHECAPEMMVLSMAFATITDRKAEFLEACSKALVLHNCECAKVEESWRYPGKVQITFRGKKTATAELISDIEEFGISVAGFDSLRKFDPIDTIDPTEKITPTETIASTDTTAPTETIASTDTTAPTETIASTETIDATDAIAPTDECASGELKVDIIMSIQTPTFTLSKIGWSLGGFCGKADGYPKGKKDHKSTCCLKPAKYDLSCKAGSNFPAWHSNSYIMIDGVKYCEGIVSDEVKEVNLCKGASTCEKRTFVPTYPECEKGAGVKVKFEAVIDSTGMSVEDLSWDITDDCRGSGFKRKTGAEQDPNRYEKTCCLPKGKYMLNCRNGLFGWDKAWVKVGPSEQRFCRNEENAMIEFDFCNGLENCPELPVKTGPSISIVANDDGDVKIRTGLTKNSCPNLLILGVISLLFLQF